jgi:hypothetical protein
MERSSELNSLVRDLYYEWECGVLNHDEVLRALRDGGLSVDTAFRQLLEQNQRARGVSFTQFMKSLFRSLQAREEKAQVDPGTCDLYMNPENLHGLILRNAPVPSSAKAPFGTDNNVFIRGVNPVPQSSDRSRYMESISDALGRRNYQGNRISSYAFKESLPESDDRSSVVSDQPFELPRHLRPSINPITGLEFMENKDDALSSCLSRRLSENTSRLASSETGLTPDLTAVSLDNQKRHFTHIENTLSLQWSPRGETSLNSNSPRPPTSNILHHDTDTHIETYRPISRVFKTQRPCPFATEKDDLRTLRSELHRTPLGRPYTHQLDVQSH